MARRKHDQYDTVDVDFAVATLLALAPDIAQPIPATRTIIEPCAGENRLTAALRAKAPHMHVFTNDLHPRMLLDKYLDAAYRPSWYSFPRAAWTVTNPPFSHALPILQNALSHSDVGAAFLLRLTFLEPTDRDLPGDFPRGEWLALNPPDQVIVLPRMSFTEDGNTDSVTCAWMVWRHCVAGTGFERGVRVVTRPKPAKMLLEELNKEPF